MHGYWRSTAPSSNKCSKYSIYSMSNQIMDIYFMDNARQDEIETFYEACQRHRNYYRGYPKAYHPLLYFKEPQYAYQCPPEMTPTYLSFPYYHVKYKQPVVLPVVVGRTSGLPPLPGRTLAGRFNKAACKAFVR